MKVSIWRCIGRTLKHRNRPSSATGLLNVKSPSAVGRSRTPTGSSLSSPVQTPRPSAPIVSPRKASCNSVAPMGSPTMRTLSPRSRTSSPRSFSHPQQLELSCVLDICDEGDGSYVVTWQPPTEDCYHVHASFSDHRIDGSPFLATAYK